MTTQPPARQHPTHTSQDAIRTAKKSKYGQNCSTWASLQAIAGQYAANPDVVYVEPNYIYHTNAFPNDPSFGSLYGMHNTGQTGGTVDADIDAPEAWDIATGSQSIIVGVIDTGVDYNHPELASNMWTNDAELNGVLGVDDDANGIVDDIFGARWTNGTGAPTSGNPFDDHYHGTHVSGTIGAAGNNALGVVGVNWNVRIMGLKFLNSAGSGQLADAVSAVEYATAMGAHMTSNSWGGGGFSQTLKNAIDAAGAADQLFIAAAGNNGRNADVFPMYAAAYTSTNIVSVAATDHNDLRASFSNYGLTSVDFGAPGVNVLSTSPGGLYRTLSGTSMACPHAAGVVALVLSQNPATTAIDLKQILMDSVDPVASMSGITVTGGRLNAAAAVLLADPAPWLSLAPVTGVISSGQSVVINVTADTTGLSSGFADSVVIRITSGDPDSPLDVPVNLNVQCTLDSDCDDGVYCNGAEFCDAASSCQPGAPIDCDDGMACTIDTCNEALTSCDNVATDPLPAPITPDPADTVIEVVLDPTLMWDGGPPAHPLCPQTYDVFFDTVNPPVTQVAAGLVDPMFTTALLTDATTYYWQVVTTDCCTQSAGGVWSFTTAGVPVLSANPVAVDFALPINGIGTVPVALTNSGNAPTTWSATKNLAGTAAQGPPTTPNSIGAGLNQAIAPNWDVPHDPKTLLVGFKADARTGMAISGMRRNAVHTACKTTKVRSCRTIPVDVVQVADGANLKAVATQYAGNPNVAFVEPNYTYNASVFPNDPSFGSLYGMHNTGQTGGTIDADIDAPEAWDIATGSATIIVGVIDTGVDYNHPELAGNMWTNDAELNGVAGIDDDANGIVDDIYGARWTNGTGAPTSGNPFDDHYHGTHVSGTIGAAGNNALGVVGVNWNVRIMGLKFLNSAGSGQLADAVSAVEYATAMGAHLTTNSWGGGGFSQTLKNAIDAAGAADQLFIAAAGNNGRNADIFPMYPAAYTSTNIVSVAATDHNDLRASFSNYGLTSVDFGAPGVNVLSTSPGGLYRTLSGTSMACPHAAGVAALVLSQNPSTTALDLKQILMDSVDPVASMSGITVTGGRLNAASAIALADPATWLSFTPDTGVIMPGQTVIVNVTGDATGLAAGFSGSVLMSVASGDPLSPLDVPVSLGVGLCTSDLECDDGVFCNGAETCGVTGTCQLATPLTCDDGVVCTADQCDELTATCEHAPDNAACDNGLVCDGVETCDALLDCQAGTPIDCSDGVTCTTDVCNPINGSCSHVPSNALCDNGMFCDGFETCDTLFDCQPGTPENCDDGIPCTVDLCDAVTDSCVSVPDDALCDDGVFCNGTEFCDAGASCMAGVDPCPGQLCDEVGDSCVGCISDLDCDDGVFCNGAETCDAFGVCQPATPVSCDDGVACTFDICNEATAACINFPSDAACDNGLFCDGAETCDPLLDCQPGTPVDCEDGVACTDDSCDEVFNICRNTPDNVACDNGLFCDGVEFCHFSLGCLASTPVNCNDGVGCTVDACDEATASCDHVPSDAACDDGLFCDGVETCNALLGCQAGDPVNCGDGVGCTIDSCDELTASCVSLPSDAVCDNGLFCDGTEFCDVVLDCQAGTPVDCDDAVACTVDSCDNATGACDNLPSDAACDNGLFCDGTETCDAVFGCQLGTVPDCSGLTDQCTDGVCDDVAGSCVALPLLDGTACSNGDGCAGDTCQAGACVPFNCGPPPPGAPTGLSGDFEDKAAISWDENPEPDVVGYNIYRSSVSGGPYAQIVTLLPSNEYEDFPPAGTNCYVVTAENSGGSESANSIEVCGVIVFEGG